MIFILDNSLSTNKSVQQFTFNILSKSHQRNSSEWQANQVWNSEILATLQKISRHFSIVRWLKLETSLYKQLLQFKSVYGDPDHLPSAWFCFRLIRIGRCWVLKNDADEVPRVVLWLCSDRIGLICYVRTISVVILLCFRTEI